MGAARKLKEHAKPVELTPLRTPEKGQSEPFKGFITLILISTLLITGLSIYFNNDGDEKLEEFIEEALNDTTGKKARHIIGGIPNELATRIGVYAERDIKGYTFSIVADAVRHIEKKHGSKNEKSRDQKGVSLKDYKELINTLYYPEIIEPVKQTNSGAKQLKFIRKDKRKYIVIVQLSNKKKALDVNTFYIKKPPITNY